MLKMKYVRVQGRDLAYRTGKPVGVFAAVHRLQQDGKLNEEEKETYYNIDQVWFQESLPNPPFYNDDEPGKPITWFKVATTAHMLEKLKPLIDMMDKHDMPYDVVYTNFVGKIVYEDKYQVAVFDE